MSGRRGKVQKLTAEFVRSILRYNRRTGIFVWRVDQTEHSRKGDVAGRDVGGYIRININRTNYYAHRLAWLYVTGDWPDNKIDHRDGDGTNNVFKNLRDATHRVNMQNQRRARSDNKLTGVLGVALHRKSGRFIAGISINGRRKFLGYHDTVEQASTAYLTAKRKLHEGCTI